MRVSSILSSGRFQLTHTVRLYIEPTVVLVSNKIDDAVLDQFDQEARAGRSNASSSESGPRVLSLFRLTSHIVDQFSLSFLLELRPSNEFKYETAKSKIVDLKPADDNGPHITFVVPGDVVPIDHHSDEEESGGRQGRLLRLASWIDIENRISVR